MQQHQRTNKAALAREFRVARSSLYYQPTQPLRDELLKEQILAVLDCHPAYGHRRIALVLGKNKKCIRRVMRQYDITPLRKRPKKPCKPGDLGQEPSSYRNYLKRLAPIRPGVVWASDFTYLWFVDQFYYLATIIDVYSREIIGVAFGPSHNRQLVMAALRDALRQHAPPRYLHSDQGSEYNSEDYGELARQHGITISMSAKGKPWENGFQESFYSQFKLELGPLTQFGSLGEVIEAVYHQIHYYNHRRIHTVLKMPPRTYAVQCSNLKDKLS